MAKQIPKFGSTALLTDGYKEIIGPIQTRFYMDYSPGINGAFVQGHGKGTREITVIGWLATSRSTTPDGAHEALYTIFKDKEALIDGETIDTYTSSDSGTTYKYCILNSIAWAGPVQFVTGAGVAGACIGARVRVTISLTQLIAEVTT